MASSEDDADFRSPIYGTPTPSITAELTSAADPAQNPTVAQILSLLATINTATNESGNIKKSCKKDILTSTKEIERLLLSDPTAAPCMATDQSATIEAVRQTIREEIAKLPTPQVIHQHSQPSYANIVRTQRAQNKESPTTFKTKPAIIIASKKNVLSPAETLKTFKNNISFRDTSFAPAGVKFVSNNKIRVEFDSIDHREQTLHKINTMPDCPVQAEKSKLLSPMVIFKGVPSDIPAEDLAGILTGQNECLREIVNGKDDLEYKFKRNNRNRALYNAVFLVSPTVWQAITKTVKLNLDHQRVHAENYIPLLQCFRCLQFGHTKARCSQETPVCSHCAVSGHDYQSCPDKKVPEKSQCYNCTQHSKNTNTKIQTKHSATSTNCPRVQLMTQKIKTRTDYGQYGP